MEALGWHSYRAQKQMISELLANKVTEAEKLLRVYEVKVQEKDPG